MDRFPWHDDDGKIHRLEVTEVQLFNAIRVLYWGETELKDAQIASRTGNSTIQKARDWIYQWLDNSDFRDAIGGFDDAINADNFDLLLKLERSRELYRVRLLEREIRRFYQVVRDRPFLVAALSKGHEELGEIMRPVSREKLESDFKFLIAELVDHRRTLEKILQKWHASRSPIEFTRKPDHVFCSAPKRRTETKRTNEPRFQE